MPKKIERTDEELKVECYHILGQMCKYEKLFKIFGFKCFEQKYKMYSDQFNRFVRDYEDILWDIVLY